MTFIILILESVFIGILIFGRNRVSKKAYWFSSFLVFFASHLSGLWIIIANSWMQTPAGFKIEGGRDILTDFFQAAFNPSTVVRFLHVLLAGWIAAEVGRQPWAVYRILKTADAASPVVPAGNILFSLIMFFLIYSVIAVAGGSILYGVALGNVIQGIQLDSNTDYAGNFFMLLRPFPLLIGLFGLVAILVQGATYAAHKTEGEIQDRARKISQKLWIKYAILLVLTLVVSIVIIPGAAKKWLAWIFTAIVAACLLQIRIALSKKKDRQAFLYSSLAFGGLWGIAGAVHFPNLVKASNDSTLSLTIHNSSSSELTLKVMLIIAVIGMPIVIGYTIYLFRVFKGKVRTEDNAY